MTAEVERIRSHIELLSAIKGRFAGSEGERKMLAAVQECLPTGAKAKVEGFVDHPAVAFSIGVHAALLVAAGLLGLLKPGVGAIVSACVTLSLIGEGTGRFSVLRRALQKTASYNLVVRSEQKEALGTVVIATPLDVAPWRTWLPRWTSGRRPLRAVVGAALIVTLMLSLQALAEPWVLESVYAGSLLLLTATVAFLALMHRRSGDGSDDGGGSALALELLEDALQGAFPNLELWVVFTGCGRAYQGGIKAFLDRHERTFTRPLLVISVMDPGKPDLQSSLSEGGFWKQFHRSTGPALVERLSWVGFNVPLVDRPGATDARAATLKGYRSLSLFGGNGESSTDQLLSTLSIVRLLTRWFGDDLSGVSHGEEK